jgi:outer membrane biosynthesis protein TonB
MKKNKIKTTTSLGPGDNYVIFEELTVDSIGKNYRAVELHKDTPIAHKCLNEVHPFLFTDPEIWNQANQLFEQVGKTGIPNLYAPEKIIKKGERTFLVSPFINGKSLAQVVEQATKKKIPIPFDLAFSIAIAVVNLIERGAAIVIKGQNSFHGLLSPDHIFMDYNGVIFLKYFGLWLILVENETAVSEMIRKYGPWLSPEFIRREKIFRQSDIYYLGYIVFRMLTGHYFSYLPGEDFESTFTSISFISDLPSTDIRFLTTLINFFKRTLNPSVNKRFSDTKEFKAYILESFHPPSDDYAAFQSRLAHYLESLYDDEMDDEEKMLAEELSPSPPETEPGLEDAMERKIIETIPLDIVKEKKQHSKSLWAALILIIIVGLVGATYIVVHQLNQAKKERQIAEKLLVEQDKEKKEFERKLLEVQQKLKALEEQKTTDQQEQQIKEQEISQLKQQEKILREKEKSREKPAADTDSPTKTSPQPVPTDRLPTEKPAVKSMEPTQDPVKQPPPPKKEMSTPAPLVPLKEATVKPTKLSGSEPQFPPEMVKTYVGRRATVNAELLIDETGRVVQVKIVNESIIPRDVRDVIVDTLIQWKYKPAQKDSTRVKVWWPYKLKIHFKYDM